MLIQSEYEIVLGEERIQAISVWVEGNPKESICLIEVDGKLVEYDEKIHID